MLNCLRWIRPKLVELMAFVHASAAELAAPLAAIFNKLLANGVLPVDWVSANITLVFKKGNKHLVSNYRSISLTCIIVKVWSESFSINFTSY